MLADKESGDALIANVKISIERQDQFHIPKIKKVEESLTTLREHARQMDEYQAMINAHIHQNEMKIKDLLARQERSVRTYAPFYIIHTTSCSHKDFHIASKWRCNV